MSTAHVFNLLCLLVAVVVVSVIAMPMFSQSQAGDVRQARYAGSWYSSNPQTLQAQLSEFIERAQAELRKHKQPQASADNHCTLAIIAPHAGYMFSGQTSAFAYAAAQASAVKRVFVLGPSHHAALHGIALPAAKFFATPIGNLPVDSELISELQSYPLFSVRTDIHQLEHSLEMQMPFIRKTFGEVMIVPLVVGTLQDESEIKLTAELLRNHLRTGDLIVVSSDFTHYGPRYGYAPFRDNIREGIEKMDREACSHLCHCQLHSFLEFQKRTDDTICGLFPCALLCAILPEHSQGELLKYSTSQDVLAEDADNSVSYLAVCFRGPGWPEHSAKEAAGRQIELAPAEKQTLVQIARKALERYVHDGSIYDPTSDTAINLTEPLKERRGAFVTLYTVGHDAARIVHHDRQLRGCIGTIWPVHPLYKAVVENAIAACSRDFRFAAVTPCELGDIEIEISVLTAPRPAKSYEDIVLGSDGIILSKNDRQAVFLPMVATEFGWDLKETLRQLSLKAGLAANDWQSGARFNLFRSVSIEEKETQAMSDRAR